MLWLGWVVAFGYLWFISDDVVGSHLETISSYRILKWLGLCF